MAEENKLLTPAEIAKRYDVSRSAVNSWLNKGDLKGFRVGNLWKVKEDDVFFFIQSSSSGERRR